MPTSPDGGATPSCFACSGRPWRTCSASRRRRKNRPPTVASDQWIRRRTPPDYRDRHLELGFRRSLIQSGDHALAVDDWIDTGSQARTIREMVDSVGATWVGLGCIVDALDDPRLRRDLRIRSLLHLRDL
jgi:adenine phosphoribosyltransferase